jgi:uncharacterized protein YneF (UPF0154 family)
MKIILRIALIISVITFITGFILQYKQYPKSEMIIGIGVLFFAFILLPLFLYHRYKKKNLKDYLLDDKKIKEIWENMKL